jgi:hypothetical protein
MFGVDCALVMQIVMRPMQRRLHQMFGRAFVACACASSLDDQGRAKAQVELGGAPPHHLPILLVLLHRHHYSHHSRSLLLASQKSPLLLVQSAFQVLVGRHANALAAGDHHSPNEGRTQVDEHLSRQYRCLATDLQEGALSEASHEGGEGHRPTDDSDQ